MGSKLTFKLILFKLYYEFVNYLIATKYLFVEILYKLNFKRHLDVDNELPQNISGRMAIVTGGTRGLGLSVVQELSRKGCDIFVGTSQQNEKHDKILSRIYEDIPEINPKTGVRRGRIQLEYLDLSSMESVKRFIDAFRAHNKKLNYLICNAGIMFAPRRLTVDGFESHLAVNYLGHCLLTMELLPMLKETADNAPTAMIPSRIVNVSSSTHFSTKFRFHDLHVEKYSAHQAYAQSKLAQIMFTYTLDRVLRENLNWSNVQVFSLHPGVVLSDLYEHVGWIKYLPFLVPLLKLITRNIVEGAETTLYATLSDELNLRSGSYLEDCKVVRSSRASQNMDAQERLWRLTNTLLEPWAPKSWIKLMLKT